jgi:hypothetical protein
MFSKTNRWIGTLIFLGMVFGIWKYLGTQPEIRKINPPKLDAAHLGKKILCHRPMRHGSPALNVIKVEDKFIANNYGHGGSGWTLGPGSAAYVIGLLQEEAGSELTKDSEITIIGAGALGLFTAFELVQQGYKNIIIVAENFEDLTSHNAGGLLAPVSMDNDVEMQKVINKIGVDAYRFYAQVAKSEHPFIKTGAVIVPTYFQSRQDAGLEPYVGVVMQPAKDVVLDFGTGTKQPMVVYDDGIFIDTGLLMQALRQVLEGKITFKQQKITDFNQIDSKFIVNCSGLGAKELLKDDKMVSVQGHLIMLKDQKFEDLQHMIFIYLPEGKTKSGKKIKRSFYMFPKRLPTSGKTDIGVIGGTFIEDADKNTPNEEEFDIMLENAKKFYGVK